jgi:hypothetical protein
MSIIEQYIEMNSEVLSKLTRENPELGTGIIDTLAVLSNYIKDNDVQFSAEQTSKMLQKVEDVQTQAEKKKEEEIKVAEVQVAEIENETTGVLSANINENATLTFTRDWLGIQVCGYFLLGYIHTTESIIFSTLLDREIFSKNPTTPNQKSVLFRIKENRIIESDAVDGVYIWKWKDNTKIEKRSVFGMPNSNLQEELIKQVSENIINEEANLVIEKQRKAIELLSPNVQNYLILEKVKNWDAVFNTMNMVAWAEGIDLDLNTKESFVGFGKMMTEAISGISNRNNERVYVIIQRIKSPRDLTMRLAYGTDNAKAIIDREGEDNAFVVAIIVDGVFQEGINPYRFQKGSNQATTSQVKLKRGLPLTQQEFVVTEQAKNASEKTTEKVFVVKLKNGDFSYEVGEDNLFNLEDSDELSDVLAVFENGLKINTIRPKRISIVEQDASPKESVSDVFVEQTDELTDEDLKNLEDLDVDTLGNIELEDLEDIDFDEE